MHNKNIFILLLALAGLWGEDVVAQSPKLTFTLTEQESGTTRDYRAVNTVSLKPGFAYQAQSGKAFRGRIDRTVSIDVVPVTNPTPGNTSGAATDKAYTPGGSYNNDPLPTGGGVSSGTPAQKVSGTTSSGSTSSYLMQSYTYPLLWFKTSPVTNNLNGAYYWRDITGHNTKLYRYSSSGAGTGTEFQSTRDTMRTFNFNPALCVSTDEVSKEILLTQSNLSQTTIMGVWGANADFEKDKFIFAINGRRNEGVVFTKQYAEPGDSTKVRMIYGTAPGKSLMARTTQTDTIARFRESALRIASYYRANKPNTSLWGESRKAVISLGGKFDSTNVNNTSKFKITDANERAAFKGYTPELLVFDRQLSGTESAKYETYLALKYGLTLDKSYIAADGTTLWDMTANSNYHHRVSGYGREDGLGLYQKAATTSYEEKPWYTDQKSNDSYEGGDSYRLSSRNRLLVMGYQPGSTPINGSYVLYGDNGKPGDSLNFESSSITGIARKLKREWLVQSNRNASSTKTMLWDGDTQIMTAVSDYSSTLFKGGSLSSTSLTVVSHDTLTGPDGYFGWTVEQEHGPIVVKFGAQSAFVGSYDYGYKIDSVGYVTAIKNGSLVNTVLFRVEKGQKLEIEKNARVMFLRVNGVRYKDTEIAIDSTSATRKFYGAISIGRNPYDIKLSNFRHGGFVNTGNRIEFSYSRLPELKTVSKEKVYLLINRSSTNVGSAPELISCSEIDTARCKLIFNNVYWEGSVTGKYAMGIGYYKPGIQGISKQTQPALEESEAELKGDLRIYYPNQQDLSTITVMIQTAKAIPSTIQVYDLSGRIVYRRDIAASAEVSYTDVKFPKAGVFIVRVVNAEQQVTQKVIGQ